MPIEPGLKEIGRSGLKQWAGQIAEEPLHRLRGKLGRRVFNEMRLNDDAVGSLLFTLTMLLRSVGWSVEAVSDEPDDQMKAEYYESIPMDMSHSFPSFISEVLSMLAFGWSYFEVVFKQRRGEQGTPGQSSRYKDGLIGIRKLALRGQDTLEKWLLDPQGGIQGMKQAGTAEPLLIERCLLFRTLHEKNNPEGLSILRPAWRSWYFKKKIQELEAITIEREGAGYPIAYVDSEIFSSTEPANLTLMNEVKDIVVNIRRDELEGAVFPLAYDEDGNKLFDLVLLTSGGSRQVDISPVIERYDRAIMRSALGEFLLLGSGGSSGSFALSKDRSALFMVAANAILDEVENVLNRHLVPRLAALNGWSGDLPEYRHERVEKLDLETIGELLKALTVSGAQIFPNDDIENTLLRSAGLPDKPDVPQDTEPGDPDESIEAA